MHTVNAASIIDIAVHFVVSALDHHKLHNSSAVRVSRKWSARSQRHLLLSCDTGSTAMRGSVHFFPPRVVTGSLVVRIGIAYIALMLGSEYAKYRSIFRLGLERVKCRNLDCKYRI